MTHPAPAPAPRRLVWVVGFVAAALLGFEISLMRVLLVGSYHHFAFLVITAALLGFGASGSALLLLRSWVMNHAPRVLYALTLATGVSIPISLAIVRHIPAEAVVLPSVFWRQVGFWLVYWIVLTIPFFVGASVLGLALMVAKDAIAKVYAVNLIGSAVGALVAPIAMVVVSPAWLAPVMGGIALIGAAGAPSASRRGGFAVLVTCVAAACAYLWLDPPDIRVDQFKDLAHLERLRAQGTATLVAEAHGPRAVVAAYRSAAFHDLPFLSVGATPPPLTAIVLDGHRAGSLLDVRNAEEADVVDHTLMAFPYPLAPDRPRVLLLGEIGGTNVWLAARHDALEIHVIQPDANVFALMRGPLRQDGGIVLDLPGVRATIAQPRHFVERTSEHFDLIQLVTLESLSTGMSGLRGLGQDDLVTVDGITACLERLSPDGLLTVSRGIQTPPRDNVKLLATFVEALKRIGITAPDRHIVIVRDYLGVCTLVKGSPWTPAEIQRVRRVCRDRELTPVWFEGIRPDELNHPDELPAARDGVGDWYHFAARQLFSSTADRFIKDWSFDIRPPTDNRPFFYDFCKLRAIRALQRAYGDTWMTRAELGLVFVLLAIVLAGVVGAGLTLVPILFVRDARTRVGKSATVGYFAVIGLAYLVLEMTFLSRLMHLIGDPVYAAAATVGGFLLFSGLGSLTAHKIRRHRFGILAWVFLSIVVVGLVEIPILWHVASVAGRWSLPLRCVLALLVMAPLAYLMGFPMPLALRRLDDAASALVPWAWGVNGFASVVAAPLATAIGMIWGFHLAAIIAMVLYVLAGLLFAKLPIAD